MVIAGCTWLYIQTCMAASHFSQDVFDCVLLMNAAHWAARTVGTKLRIHFPNFERQIVQGETLTLKSYVQCFKPSETLKVKRMLQLR